MSDLIYNLEALGYIVTIDPDGGISAVNKQGQQLPNPSYEELLDLLQGKRIEVVCAQRKEMRSSGRVSLESRFPIRRKLPE